MLKLAYLLSCLTVVNAGSHSLMALVTYIVGQTPFPEFSVVVMLDDLQIGYYDSTTWKAVYRSHSDSKYYDEEQSDAGVLFQDMYNEMKTDSVKKHLNITDGVHVLQRLAGCELLNDDKPGPLHFWDALDGQNIMEFTYDLEKNDIQMKKTWIPWNQVKQLKLKFIYENVFHPICIKVLRRYLNMEKNNVMRKVKPRVRIMKKTLPDSQGLQMSCLATGFYPRHINLTLFRDDQPVDDDQITGGEILPNGDRTYQMRKSLVISTEELRKRHKYSCTMKHLNLDNKLDITFDVAESDPGSFSLSVVISVLVLLCVAVLIIPAIIIWRKKSRASGRGPGMFTKPLPGDLLRAPNNQNTTLLTSAEHTRK
ncbi:class I histocompatibility antigen, Gogo-OKO alpha chain-like isoform X2 [Megalobrama amblycephala]|uniref:class I histocompatibility antigen, Gogo-OKO alpha chain-like isoform X2 n=1 Tax=Megalobrama amblycephala TaxID=75352 RepID=UPI002014146D|nr:class I histocompatibility antigen, Gogo-OKO alpha chain-like isoform X2 [Megalobrama amblycephala]